MYRKKHVIDTAVIHLIWLLAIMAASCSAITDDVPAQDDATLRLNIVSRDEGRLDTRAVTEAGNSHEFIHRLCVLIVAPDGTVVKKLLPNLDVVALAQQGNLRRWASDDFTITLGAYDVYAFANIDTYYDGLWGSLTGLAEGDNISGISPSLRSIVLADPASKIDFVDYFIPMSAYARVNVTKSTSAISIGLDRLVSKVRMTIRGKAGTTVTALSFAGYADRVGLFADTPLGDVKTMESNVVGVSPKTVQIGKKDSVSIADFYVNSSPAGRPYSVSVATNEHGGVVYKATTARTELPRNSIYPLILQLNDYGLDLEAEVWVSPIGSLPVPVVADFDAADTYSISIPEGAQFRFTVRGISAGGTTVPASRCVWSFDAAAVSGVVFDGYAPGAAVVKGRVTAQAGLTIPLAVTSQWRQGNVDYNRGYTVRVTTTDLSEATFKNVAQGSPLNVERLVELNTEMLNLFK